jgi:hypothetical protein
MRLADFYLAASAVLPILVFADTLKGRAPIIPLRNAEVVDRLNRTAPRVEAFAGIFWWPFYGWSEWISLRSLQLGHSATGGTTVVWIAIGLAFMQLMVTDILARWFATSAPDG